MVFFSFAYISLDAGTGALILFGAVQVTMFVVAMRNREYFPPAAWIGFLLAVAGLIYLVSPGVSAPSAGGATLMAIAGIAWGAYSLIGRTAPEPLSSTATSFIGAVPLVLITSAVFAGQFAVSATGLTLAVIAGAITSGLGYVTWYAALRDLSAGNAATIQLTVPLIAAIGGALFLSEAVTLRLLVSSAAILGGVALVLAQRSSGERR
jgi:drug/metabolite transporter (DMT)-like permease